MEWISMFVAEIEPVDQESGDDENYRLKNKYVLLEKLQKIFKILIIWKSEVENTNEFL